MNLQKKYTLLECINNIIRIINKKLFISLFIVSNTYAFNTNYINYYNSEYISYRDHNNNYDILKFHFNKKHPINFNELSYFFEIAKRKNESIDYFINGGGYINLYDNINSMNVNYGFLLNSNYQPISLFDDVFNNRLKSSFNYQYKTGVYSSFNLFNKINDNIKHSLNYNTLTSLNTNNGLYIFNKDFDVIYNFSNELKYRYYDFNQGHDIEFQNGILLNKNIINKYNNNDITIDYLNLIMYKYSSLYIKNHFKGSCQINNYNKEENELCNNVIIDNYIDFGLNNGVIKSSLGYHISYDYLGNKILHSSPYLKLGINNINILDIVNLSLNISIENSLYIFNVNMTN